MLILAFTTDVIPVRGLPTSGTSLRTYGLIQGLRAHGHEVVVSVPKSALAGLRRSIRPNLLTPETQAELEAFERYSFDASNQQALIHRIEPDTILCGHWPAMTLRAKPRQTLIVDLAGPHLLERHYQGSPNQIGAVFSKLSAMSTADYFIVSGPKQRLYFLAFLLRAGVDRPESRIVTIPMPLDPSVPDRPAAPRISGNTHRGISGNTHGGGGDAFPRYVFGGVFLPWQNPAAALETVVEHCGEHGLGELLLIGGKHPNYDIKEGVYARLFEALEHSPHVRRLPLLPYESFCEELLQRDVAVDLMSWNLERELAMTIRSTTYLWSGVPVIYNDYADLSTLIRRYDAGWCVPPDDRAALRAVLDEIVANPEVVAAKSANATRLAREVFSWDRAVRPLLDLVGVTNRTRLREIDIIVDFPDNAQLPLLRGAPVEQHFVARMDGLARVECRIATHNRPIREALTLSLFRSDASGTRSLVAERELPPAELVNNDWTALDVPAVADSGGASFVLRIEAPEAALDSSASPWAVKGSPYPLTQLMYSGTTLDGTALCMRTTCAGHFHAARA